MSNRGRTDFGDGHSTVASGGGHPSAAGTARSILLLAATASLALAGAGAGVAVAAAKHRTTASTLNRHAFRGTTAQGLKVSLSAVKKSFRGRTFTYQATMSCSDGSTFTDAAFSDDVRLRKGRFRVAYTSDRGATKTVVRGTIKGRRASGQIRIVEFYASTPDANGNLPLQPGGPVRCDSGNVGWTAR